MHMAIIKRRPAYVSGCYDIVVDSFRALTHTSTADPRRLLPDSTLYFNRIHTKATTRGSPRCNSRVQQPVLPEGRPLQAPPSPNGCHCRMPLLRGLRLITSPVQLSPVQGGWVVITIPALVGAHIGPDICVCAPPPPLQRGTTKSDKQWTPRHNIWQDLEEHNRLASRECQVKEVRRLCRVSPV